MKAKELKARIMSTYVEDTTLEAISGWVLHLCSILEDLDKRVAELEGRVPEQPKAYEVKLTLDANDLAKKITEALKINYEITLEPPKLLKPKTNV
ncbi:hypothetical protein [Carboxydothermus pertinax]|uniref:Uncharacterized protein n=1 Tax=Carboxydothermus pertinax TaxID=870242 RepID=A0A1L8CRT5_9THEO|nr:hypothetical protein [Carboxydothermus pertinax]GAV21574.1 hypothetical protein cpu_00840 [Carboxydothermus pertinax]